MEVALCSLNPVQDYIAIRHRNKVRAATRQNQRTPRLAVDGIDFDDRFGFGGANRHTVTLVDGFTDNQRKLEAWGSLFRNLVVRL